MSKSLTLVIAVYDAARYLEFIFAALARQSLKEFEVIVADDGSGPEIAALVRDTASRVPFPITHLWQPDEGFRKNAMLNKAIDASKTGYLVFIDGDCVPHREFISDHWEYREPSGVLCGRRVNCSNRMTERLTLGEISSGRLDTFSLGLLIEGLTREATYVEEAIRIKNPVLRRAIRWKAARILGCNFSVEKKFLEKVNGFNEDYRSPGLGEDSDIGYRLALAGARLVNLRHLAVLYHLYHPKVEVVEENKRLYERTVASMNPLCKNGLLKLS